MPRSPFTAVRGSFTATLTGCTTSPTGTASWEIGLGGCSVTVALPEITATSNSTSATISGLPENIWPAAAQTVLVRTVDNGSIAVAAARVGTSGTIDLYRDSAESSFTAVGTKGIKATTVTYAWGG